MTDWPQLDELKQVLDVESTDWDGEATSGEGETRLTRLLEAAITYVKGKVGDWDEIMDIPNASQAQAALRAAELMALKPELAATVRAGGRIADPTLDMLLFGQRRKFGVA